MYSREILIAEADRTGLSVRMYLRESLRLSLKVEWLWLNVEC